MRDWINEEIVVRYQYNFCIFLARVEITRQTEKSVYVKIKFRGEDDEEIIRLSKDKIDSPGGQRFEVRYVIFRLLNNMLQCVQDEMKGKQEIEE